GAVAMAGAGRPPPPRPGRLGHDRRPGGAHRDRPSRAVRLLRPNPDDVREPPARRTSRSDRAAHDARLPRLSTHDPARLDGWPRTARTRRPPHARSDRARTRLPHLALTDS